jgi:Dyp-type peroxidase family
MLELGDIQGDIVIGLQKDFEDLVFFKIIDRSAFKTRLKQYGIGRITTAQVAHQRESAIHRPHKLGLRTRERFAGLNLGFTQHGLDQLVGDGRPRLDLSFEKGADNPDTITALSDPPKSAWLRHFVSERIDGVFLLTGPNRSLVSSHSNQLRALLSSSIRIVYSEIGNTRPGTERRHEHFGFPDGISQPGIRDLTPVSDPRRRPGEGLPGQDLLWPGEFVFGYPGQHPEDPDKAGPEPEMAAPWMKNGSYMVFRRLEQRVPEFWRFVRQQAGRLGMDAELLAARMVGRWKSGAPVELAPLRDDPGLGGNEKRNNDFEFAEDRFQRKCPYAAHIRKVYPRDDVNEAEAQRHRIIRQGIAFGPEVAPGETVTRHSRGLMFVCYQTSIERQFEYIQRQANDPGFVRGKQRPGGGAVIPGFDPIIGQAERNGVREMDEPYPNYPAGNRRTTLEIPKQFVELTAAAYFFMPSLTALRTALT